MSIFLLEALLLWPTTLICILLPLIVHFKERASHLSLLMIIKHEERICIRFKLPNRIPSIVSSLPLLYLNNQILAHVL